MAQRTKIRTILLASAGMLAVGTWAGAQNLRVHGTTTGDGEAYFMARVGIGTATPGQKLQVKGGSMLVDGCVLMDPYLSNESVYGTGQSPCLWWKGTGGTYTGAADGSWVFQGGNVILQSTASRLGIGKAHPEAPLHVAGEARADTVTATAQATAEKYFSVKAWPGYGTGQARFWYDGTSKVLQENGGSLAKLRLPSLAGTGERKLCADALGTLIPCTVQ